jgi:hypothetical protein
MQQNGKTLSMHSEAIYKGDYTHNGTLLKLHENSYTIGYSALLKPDASGAGTVKFGNGVFLDLSKRNNNIYAGIPTGTGAVPAFGGIMVREPAVASGYPVLNDEISGFQHGMLCREGYVIYKKGVVFLGSGSKFVDVEVFPYVFQNYCLWVRKSDGVAYFTPKSTVYETSGDIFVGRVVEINPDDRSVTVYISPAIQSNTADIAGATPTITVDSAGKTNTTIPFAVTLGTEGTIKLSYKAHSSADYILIDGDFVPVYDENNSNYKLEYTLEGLTKNTAYDIKADAITACGVNSDTEENVSTTNV